MEERGVGSTSCIDSMAVNNYKKLLAALREKPFAWSCIMNRFEEIVAPGVTQVFRHCKSYMLCIIKHHNHTWLIMLNNN
jgi:hypothetical protein